MTIPAILQVLQTVRPENPEAPQILQLHDDRSFSHDRRTLTSEKRGALQVLQILQVPQVLQMLRVLQTLPVLQVLQIPQVSGSPCNLWEPLKASESLWKCLGPPGSKPKNY